MFQSENQLTLFLKQSNLENIQYIISLDEVGRGCVAGPVVACATLWALKKSNQSWITEIKDSKKLSPLKRQSCFTNVLNEFQMTMDSIPYQRSSSSERKVSVGINAVEKFPIFKFKPSSLTYNFMPDLQNKNTASTKKLNSVHDYLCIGFCIGESSIEELENFNIWNSVQIAMGRALLGLKEQYFKDHSIKSQQCVLLMDGNKPILVPACFENVCQVTSVQADNNFTSVGLSSILAKVFRDTYMEGQDLIYPQFGFKLHKGYGTKAHFSNIIEHGMCPLHRPSFLKKLFLKNDVIH